MWIPPLIVFIAGLATCHGQAPVTPKPLSFGVLKEKRINIIEAENAFSGTMENYILPGKSGRFWGTKSITGGTLKPDEFQSYISFIKFLLTNDLAAQEYCESHPEHSFFQILKATYTCKDGSAVKKGAVTGCEAVLNREKSVVYSFGGDGSFKFEESISTDGAQVHVFDCYNELRDKVPTGIQVHHHKCIADRSGETNIASLMKTLGHDQIDHLQLTLDGEEFQAIPGLRVLKGDQLPRQIGLSMSVWPDMPEGGRSIKKLKEMLQLMLHLHNLGYRLMAREDNSRYPCCTNLVYVLASNNVIEDSAAKVPVTLVKVITVTETSSLVYATQTQTTSYYQTVAKTAFVTETIQKVQETVLFNTKRATFTTTETFYTPRPVTQTMSQTFLTTNVATAYSTVLLKEISSVIEKTTKSHAATIFQTFFTPRPVTQTQTLSYHETKGVEEFKTAEVLSTIPVTLNLVNTHQETTTQVLYTPRPVIETAFVTQTYKETMAIVTTATLQQVSFETKHANGPIAVDLKLDSFDNVIRVPDVEEQQFADMLRNDDLVMPPSEEYEEEEYSDYYEEDSQVEEQQSLSGNISVADDLHVDQLQTQYSSSQSSYEEEDKESKGSEGTEVEMPAGSPNPVVIEYEQVIENLNGSPVPEVRKEGVESKPDQKEGEELKGSDGTDIKIPSASPIPVVVEYEQAIENQNVLSVPEVRKEGVESKPDLKEGEELKGSEGTDIKIPSASPNPVVVEYEEAIENQNGVPMSEVRKEGAESKPNQDEQEASKDSNGTDIKVPTGSPNPVVIEYVSSSQPNEISLQQPGESTNPFPEVSIAHQQKQQHAIGNRFPPDLAHLPRLRPIKSLADRFQKLNIPAEKQ